jgi:hypothetical protein
MGEDDEGKKSKFNSGVALAERLDQLQRALNSSRYNFLCQNPEVGKWNYEIFVTSLDGCLSEAWAKMTEKEKVDADRIQSLVHSFTEYNPIILNSNNEIRIHKENYRKFLELVKIYEKKVKIYLDKHNLNAPDSEDDEGL